MKLEEHRFDGMYRQGFRLEVMPVSTGQWVRIATFKVESADNRHAARQAFGYYDELKTLIENDQPISPLGLCKGIVLWADPLVSCHLELGLNAATPSLTEAFDHMNDALEHVAHVTGTKHSPGMQVLRAARKMLGRNPAAEHPIERGVFAGKPVERKLRGKKKKGRK